MRKSIVLNSDIRFALAISMLKAAKQHVASGRYTGLCAGLNLGPCPISMSLVEYEAVRMCLIDWIAYQLGKHNWYNAWLYGRYPQYEYEGNAPNVLQSRLAWADHMINVLKEMREELE